ncbi:MAG: heparinase II/III family protein [Xanthomonadaceae bacterium]|nr:heparinase II/III family protein [Xanthomonadaceae bacterium]
MNVAALRHAGWSGLANRGLQVVSRALDRVAVRAGHPRYAPLDTPPRASDLDSRCFFAGASDATAAAWLRAVLPEVTAHIIQSANSAIEGRFDLLGYRALECGDPIDWHRDPVSGLSAPHRHWSLLDPLDYATLGDHKVTWELNRHQWFIDLGQAWRLTGERRYADAFAATVERWMAANEPGQGINWASSLEAAFRTVSWCWAMFLLDGAPEPDRKLARRMRAWIGAHAQHIERYLSYYYSPNTHLTGEALGLFYAGIAFPDLPGARRWRKLGRRILVAEFDRQVHADGVYFEQAACYQRYTAEIYLHFIALAKRAGEPVPESVTRGVQRLLDALLWLRGPDGLLPAIGDDDGGMLMRAAGRTSRDPAGVFAVAAALFCRADYAWAAGGPQPETAWMLGVEGIAAFAELAPSPPNGAPSRLLPDGGYAVMRSDWGHDAHCLIVDAGPLGCPVSGGHGHADLLSLHCHAFGLPAIVDPGTGQYPTEGGWRRHFRETGAHSTVTVDGLSQAESTGPFSWHERCDARVREWQSSPTHDLLDAEHDAYRRLADPVTHRRRVLFVKPHYWVVVDDLGGADTHTIEARFAARLARTRRWIPVGNGRPRGCRR